MADTVKIDSLLNQIGDESTRRAVRAIFYELKADLDANKAAFDEHTHYVAATGEYASQPAEEAPANSTGTRETFTQRLQ